MKFNQTLMTAIRADIEEGNVPMLVGEPGIGKSSWLEALAASMHTKCFTLACNQLADKADLTGARLVPAGKRQVTKDDGSVVEEEEYKQVFFPHEAIADAIEYAEEHPHETPLLFLDEINRTEAGVTSAALSIPTARKIGKKKLPTNLKVVIAGNDKGNITVLDSASISRFVLYNVAPDTQTFLEIHGDLNPFIQAVLKKHPECIFCKTLVVAASGKHDDDDDSKDKKPEDDVLIEDILEDSDEMSQFATPRTIAGLSRWLNKFTNADLINMLSEMSSTTLNGEEISVLQESIIAHVGNTNFSVYLMSEIADKVMTTSNQQNATVVNKPPRYDEMKACTTVTTLNDFVENLDDRDKSGCLLYALYEHADNKPYIESLAAYTQTLIKSDITTLMALSLQDNLDDENVNTFLETNTAIAASLKAIL